jgi:hypothetical protein
MRVGLDRYWRAATWLLVATVAFDLAHPLAAHCSEGTPLHDHQPAEETGHDSCGADEDPTPAGPAASAPHAGHATDCGCDGACLCHGQLTPATVAVLPTIAPVLRDVVPPRTAGPHRGSSSSVYRPPRG